MRAHTLRGGVGRPLDQMLLDGLAGPLGIGVEGDQPLGLAAVVQTVACTMALDDRPVVGPGRQHGLQLGPEGELLDIFQQGVDALAALAVVDEPEQLLEHARRGARGGHELHDAQTPGGTLLVAGRGRVGLRRDRPPVTPSPGEAARTTFRKGNPRRKFSSWVSDLFGGEAVARMRQSCS